MARGRIYVVEDESDIAEILEYNLTRENFEVEVFGDGKAAFEAIQRRLPDLVIVDLMLPAIDGLELTRLLKSDARSAQIPLVMLTAKGEEVDRIVGLELGADDYITKPFSPREVVLRVKAVLRRHSEAAAESKDLSLGKMRLDLDAHRFELDGQEITLTATEFRLLKVLIERRGRVQSRSRLLADVWGYAEDIDSRTVDTHIRRVRRKLGSEADRIETVIGVGYRMRV